MKYKLFASALTAAVLTLISGCETGNALLKDAQKGLDQIKPLVSAPNKVTELLAWSAKEIEFVNAVQVHQKANGLGHSVADRKLQVRSAQNPSQRVQEINIVASLRMELPIDAIAARHASAGSTIAALAEYISRRQAHEPTRMVIVANDPLSAAWMEQQAVTAFQKSNSKTTVNVEVSATARPSIGWMSTGPIEKSV